MIRKVCFFVLALLLTAGAYAQKTTQNQYTKAADSDPEAKAVLDQVRKKYDAYQSLEADFVLEIELPEQPKETQKGKIARKGQQYHLALGTQEVISDGKALYFILHNNKEVQINDLPEPGEDAGLLTPQSLFNFYDNKNFVAALADERTEAGKVVQYIELKPTDRASEYSKLRVVIDKKTKDIKSIKAFGKDGSRYTFTLTATRPNSTLAADRFAFNKGKYAGYHVEDLRI